MLEPRADGSDCCLGSAWLQIARRATLFLPASETGEPTELDELDELDGVLLQ